MATLWRLKRHSATLTLYQLPDQRTERRSPLVRQSLDCLLGIAPRDAGLGVLSGRVAFNVYPGLKHPTSQSDSTELAEVVRLSSRRSPTSRLAFWRHLPQHEGRHSFSDGGLG